MIPVVVGGDIGAYALMRAFHEHSGVRGVVVARVVTRPFAHSRIASVKIADVEDPEIMVAALIELAAERAGERLVLLTNADWYVEAIIAARDRLEPFYDIPMCSAETFARVSVKQSFQEDCEALGIPVPVTVPVNVAATDAADDENAVARLTYPVIGKPSSSAEYHYVEFPGKQKVHLLASRAEAAHLLGLLRDAGYAGTFLLQEFIPGDETHMRSLTAYRDARGVVTMLATGQVLLQEHTPGTLGVPAAIMTTPYVDAMDAMTRYLDRVGYRGFANADYKLDPRTGAHVFFEINPRIGRNNYYVTAAGLNPAEFVAADLAGSDVAPQRASTVILYSVVPVALLRRYLPDAELRRAVGALARRALARPLFAPSDRHPQRLAGIVALTLNYWRKFRTYYPHYTETGM